MQPTTLLLVLIVMAFIAYQMGLRRSFAVVGGKVKQLHSLPIYHGSFVALAAFIPAFFIFSLLAKLAVPPMHLRAPKSSLLVT